MLQKDKPIRSKKIRDSAKGEDCQVRIAGVCNFNPETVVFAHLGGGGMGAKVSDIHGAYCCSSCHDAVDGRIMQVTNPRFVIELAFYDGMVRTQNILVEKGLIKV